MPSEVYKVRAKVWLYPAMDGWHFVHVDKKQSTEIKEKHSKIRRGFGSLPVEVTIGKTTWNTSIFPDKDGSYLLPLKAPVRKKERIGDGDTITFTFRIR